MDGGTGNEASLSSNEAALKQETNISEYKVVIVDEVSDGGI